MTEYEERREQLIRSGVLRPGTSDPLKTLEEPPLEVSTSILEALKEERADRR